MLEATTNQDGSISTHAKAFPEALPEGVLDKFQKLSPEQAGHIRHFHNLANQPDGEWAHMGLEITGQESDDAFRYQISHMAYAAAAAHYHRLPVLRSVFKPLIEQLIHKMLHRDVWGYWYFTSQAGKFSFPDMKELRAPWPDPIRRENIMYSGHLFLMLALHGMLFDDDKYDKPDGIVLNWNPIFFGMGPEKFSYSRSDIQKIILDQFEESGWMGVCCEPNLVFVVCNQFPLVAIRYNDIIKSTNVIDGVLKNYTAVWEKKAGGFVNKEAGQIHLLWKVREDSLMEPLSVGLTAWAGSMMNGWNPDYVHSIYPLTCMGYVRRLPDGRITINDPRVAKMIRSLIAKEENLDPDAPETVSKATRIVEEDNVPRTELWKNPILGQVAMWMSEVAPKDAEGILRHADQYLNPTWEKGGLFYPRRDGQYVDDDGNWIRMDPFTGNSLLGYARLNVPDGQRIMWKQPWTKEHFSTYPFVSGVDLRDQVDFLRGSWDEELRAMAVTVRTWDGSKKEISLEVKNLPIGTYGIYESGKLVQAKVIESREDVAAVTVHVGPNEVDVVLLQQN